MIGIQVCSVLVGRNIPKKHYDLLEILCSKVKSNMIDIHVKLFDVNLFGNQTQNKRKRKCEK
jgi:hypothetical protein